MAVELVSAGRHVRDFPVLGSAAQSSVSSVLAIDLYNEVLFIISNVVDGVVFDCVYVDRMRLYLGHHHERIIVQPFGRIADPTA
ncbi:hypothetical protein [Mycobacterium uberis]|uniref:hypothetical protein n=1 Tax=Mycobacterium uberis TaxID=2162698 RepID=UPI001FB1DAEF|nr:hypothetical protein [Mycobacterium uberis]